MSKWVAWFWDVLSYMGLAHSSARILFLGLDNAGKTTLLHLLSDGRMAVHPPTFHPTSEELTVGSLNVRAYDLGGHEAARQVWQNYYAAVDGIVYLVDASDSERLAESKKELLALLSVDELRQVPMLVLGNKIDAPGAVSEDTLRSAMGIEHTTGKYTAPAQEIRSLEVFMCSLVRRQGYGEGFQWLAARMK